MGDQHTSTTETLQQLQSRNRQIDERIARSTILGGQYLNLDEDSMHWIVNHIDCFVIQSRGNESVEEVYLYPNAFYGEDDDAWYKVGEAVGNLQALERLRISTRDRTYGDHYADQVLPDPDWGELALILSRLRQKVMVDLDDSDLWAVGELRALARVIRGHPMIRSFDSCYNFPYESMDSLYSSLATLPALESITLSNTRRQARPDESTLAHHKSLTKLLRVPSLRSVSFDCFSFTSALCQATANAFMEGTAVTKLEFKSCSFSALECALIMANGLSRNTSVSHIKVISPPDQTLYSALATALLSNSTLRDLYFVDFRPHLSSVFSALETNIGLKSLRVDVYSSMDESLSTAMKNGLGMNESLESLELNQGRMCDDNTDFWCRALSFLRTNKALKSLTVNFEEDAAESHVSGFRIEIAAMLQENTSLETLYIRKSWDIIKAEDYIVLVPVLQGNTTLKTLSIYPNKSLRLTDDEDKQMAALLTKNYSLENLPDMDLENEVRDVGTMLRLNVAGRRYLLVQDGSSIPKGVEVLSRVNDDINCVFLHLLENPRLCDRSNISAISPPASSDGSTTSPPTSSIGAKRDQASAHGGQESRRRLA
jgi:hypothetical protein